jgi:hypothetical protein
MLKVLVNFDALTEEYVLSTGVNCIPLRWNKGTESTLNYLDGWMDEPAAFETTTTITLEEREREREREWGV